MTIGFNTTSKYLTFNEFLLEVNYGIAQKEKRFDALKEIVVDDMTKVLSSITKYKPVISNTIEDIQIATKYIEHKNIEFDLLWNITWKRQITLDGVPNLVDGMDTNFDHKNNSAIISFTATTENQDTDQSFIQRLLKFVKSEYFEVMLLHELGHVLDYMDELFDVPLYSHYKSIKDIDKGDYKKEEAYMSQDIERNVYFSSVIKDLERLKKLHPTMKLNDVLQISDYYEDFITRVRPIFRKKFLSKIVYFWAENYGADNMTRRIYKG